MLDYIIVGCGIGGIAVAETLLQNNKSFFVFDTPIQNASSVAAGIYNPVILKRFTTFPHAQEQLTYADQFYKALEEKLNVSFFNDLPVYRKFFSVEEQNNWFAASDKPFLSSFLSTQIKTNDFISIKAPHGYGEVLQTGFLDTKVVLKRYHEYLFMNNLISFKVFDYNELKILSESVTYKSLSAKNIIFCEGFGMHSNPYFNYLPLDGTKGELLLIKALKLDLNVILNSSLYIVPMGNHLFKVGATYNWSDKTSIPTASGKEELLTQLREIIDCDFEILEHVAGIRPTVKDRKLLMGTHDIYKKLHIFNGLGTRGVMQAPFFANSLFNYIENKVPLDKEFDIKRFNKNHSLKLGL
jgi:glycine oxidase